MAGLRGEDEILEAFADLEYIPGSKRKRRDEDPKVSRRKNGESNGWDANPIIKTLGGKETEVFTISALAQALEKTIVTVRLWERKGYIPKAPYRGMEVEPRRGSRTSSKGCSIYSRRNSRDPSLRNVKDCSFLGLTKIPVVVEPVYFRFQAPLLNL